MRPEQSAFPKNRSTVLVLTFLVVSFTIWLVDLLSRWQGNVDFPVASLFIGAMLLLSIFVLMNRSGSQLHRPQNDGYVDTVNRATSLSGIGLLQYFPEKNLWRLNHLAQAMLKRSSAEFEAPLEEVLERVRPDDFEAARLSAEKAITERASVSGTLHLGDEADGYALIRYQVFPGNDGSLMATLVNVDGLAYAEDSNQRNLRRLTKALEVTEAVWLEINLETGGLNCNYRAHQLLGLEADADVNALLKNVHESYRDDFLYRLQSPEGLAGVTPYPLTLSDGQERWIRFTSDKTGSAERLSLTAVDITEQTLQEHQQRSLVNQLSAAAEAAQLAIFDEDIEAEELTAVYQPLKAPIEFYAGNELLLHVPAQDHKKLAKAQADVGSFAEISFVGEGGQQARVKYSVIEEFIRQGRQMRRILVQNVSDQANQRKQLQETIDKMQQVQGQLESKAERERQMFAVIGHELRTPAASIKMLLDDMKFAESSDEARLVTEQVEHLLTLLDDVRVLVNPDRVYDGKESRVQLKSLLQSALQPLEPILRSAGMHASLVADEGADEEYLINTQMLRQLVMNLVRNAALHSGGSFMNLVVRTKEVDDLHIEATLRFEDNGKGITEAFRASLFEPFHRENRDAPGMGLGLSICAALASKLGGSISYSDYPGGGSVFEVKIVATRVDVEVLKNARVETIPNRMNGDWSEWNVLLAEDNKTIHMLTEKMLTTKGATVYGGMDGAEALELFDNNPIDLVVTDISMPNMDGYELVKKLRERGFSGPIIGVSAAVVGSETEDLIRDGANVVLSKPLRMSELEQQLTKLNQLS